MPMLGGATEWVKSDPLGPAELRGHVVLVNFWTLTCINWLPQEPYVRAWSEAYRDDSAPKEENFMSRTQQAHGEVGREAIAGRGRRWYHLRPQSRRRTDPHGLQLHVVDGGGLADCHRPGRLSVPVVVVT
jgi:hypothetical protein